MPSHFDRWCFIAILLTALSHLPAHAAPTLELLESKPIPDADTASELSIEIVEPADKPDQFRSLPARITITAPDGKHPDGSGRDVYADGRFFAEGSFKVRSAPGKHKVFIQCGPEYEPLTEEIDLAAGKLTRARVVMKRWFDAAAHGWYCGDNHVHTQHDARATVRTDPTYTALQARANGLRFITEADHEISSDTVKKLDTPTFLYRQAPELRPGPFVGHLNTPGISSPITGDDYQKLINRPLPALALHEEIRKRGGAMIRTHPFTPPYQLHWMGAAETWSDAALGQAGDLIDIDSQASELLYFAALNLGNRIGVSSYTDCALGRKQTMSPGDRRVYCKAKEFTYPAIVDAMKQGRTMATNGGPIFAFLTVGGKEPGETNDEDLSVDGDVRQALAIRCKVHSLRPLRSLEVFHRNGLYQSFNVAGKSGTVEEASGVGIGSASDWFVLRAEDETGAWSITSPVYLLKRSSEGPSSAILFEISNHTRFIQLRKQFFAHMIATLGGDERITSVRLLRDGKVENTWSSDKPDERKDERIPVTDLRGDYVPGTIWHEVGERIAHFQADWPVKESGWYKLEVETSDKRIIASHALRFDADAPNSHAISFAQLTGRDTSLTLRGYGEEQALRDIRSPFVGDGWWYPRNTMWQLKAKIGKLDKEVGNPKGLDAHFRAE